jgi:hypothetical protein
MPLIPSLSYRVDLITPAEEQALIDRIAAVPVSPFRFQRWEGKRQTASFGWRSTSRMRASGRRSRSRTTFEPAGQGCRLCRLPPDDLVQVLVTRYDPGAGIGWHRDRSVFAHVMGYRSARSRAAVEAAVRDGFAAVSVPIPARSVNHLIGDTRHQWERSIAAMEVQRWSITFPSLAAVIEHAGGGC